MEVGERVAQWCETWKKFGSISDGVSGWAVKIRPILAIACLLLACLALAEEDAPASFRPYADGYWVAGVNDGPSKHYRDMDSALDDATKRWCDESRDRVNCRWQGRFVAPDQGGRPTASQRRRAQGAG